MTGKTFFRCSTCGTTIAAGDANAAGWLVHTNVHRHDGAMVIRCPKHITDYARRQTRLTEAEINAIEDTTRDPHDAYYRE